MPTDTKNAPVSVPAAAAPAAAAPAAEEKKAPVARTSVETKHLMALLNGEKIAPEYVKKYRKLAARAEFSASFDASN